MTLSRHCDACKNSIINEYYDLAITIKEALKEPSQDGANYYGDYCLECIGNGKAIKHLLNEIKIRL
jgi:hypothetical protein